MVLSFPLLGATKPTIPSRHEASPPQPSRARP
uniref:Uncharacterized protein n=1 Tax=Arundo donax TaxID=35708 RepID=A0A0A8Y6P2_ARUDO